MVSWLPITFWGLLVPALIVIGVLYGAMRKVYPLMWVLAVFTYINAVAHTIDAYQLGKGGILALLSLSAILMIGFGLYISWVRKKKGTKEKKGKK